MNSRNLNKEYNNPNPRILKILWNQQNNLKTKHPEGVKIIINDENPVDINAEITGPQDTPYKDGIFKISLLIPNDFPNSPPKGIFITKIYHPNISEKGEICVNTLKRDWDPRNWSLFNILEVIKCLLIIPFPESSLNQEAGKLFMEDYNEYFKLAKLYTEIHAIRKDKINSLNQEKKTPNQKNPDIILKNDLKNKITSNNDSIVNYQDFQQTGGKAINITSMNSRSDLKKNFNNIQLMFNKNERNSLIYDLNKHHFNTFETAVKEIKDFSFTDDLSKIKILLFLVSKKSAPILSKNSSNYKNDTNTNSNILHTNCNIVNNHFITNEFDIQHFNKDAFLEKENKTESLKKAVFSPLKNQIEIYSDSYISNLKTGNNEENKYLFRQSKNILIQDNFIINPESPILGCNLFKKKVSNFKFNDNLNLESKKDVYFFEDNYKTEAFKLLNKSNSQKPSINNKISFTFNKTQKNRRNDISNLKTSTKINFQSKKELIKPPLGELPFLRSSHNLNKFHNSKIDNYSTFKTPNKTDKDEIQKWLLRI